MLDLSNLGAKAGRTWLWRGVDLSLNAGHILGVLGPNGVGKTTLLRCLAGLRLPNEGAVQKSARIGYVAQSPRVGQPLRVSDFIAAGLATRKSLISRINAQDRAAVAAALSRVGARHLSNNPVTLLSGGELKLVLIARALVTGARLLILDEPMAGLDLHHQVQVLRLFRALAMEGCALIWSAHDPNHLLAASDQLLVLERGRDPILGAPEDLLSPARLQELFSVPFHETQTAAGPQFIPDFQ